LLNPPPGLLIAAEWVLISACLRGWIRAQICIVPARDWHPNYHHYPMGRLCERPGCSENAAVAYGMRTEDLVFWLDALRESTPSTGGVLCQRHGDSMVVPRGWTLDDLRDPELHLFRPPSRTDRVGPRARRRPGSNAANGAAEQLELGGLAGPVDAEPEHRPVDVAPAHSADGSNPAPGPMAVDETPSDPGPDERWAPNFDAADDLDGLLSARSPLLSRAFRGTDRPG
jgi:hypothetical protein